MVDTDTVFEAEPVHPPHASGISPGFLDTAQALGASPRLLGELRALSGHRPGSAPPRDRRDGNDAAGR